MNEIEESLLLLNKWFERNGWQGYDPYDIKATKPYLWSQKSKYTNFVMEKLVRTSPGTMRKIFTVKPLLYPLVPFHLAHAYLNMYESTGNKKYLDNAKSCLKWLTTNSWGEPFDWQSIIFIPKGTPDAYNIVNICNLFLHAHMLFNELKYLDIVKESCNFLISNLNIDVISKNKICFSYTSLDNFHVHNVNLYVASLLYKMGTLLNKKDYINVAERSMNYSINCQNKDGSWYYWGPPDPIFKKVDNYHTAFVIKSLLDIYKINRDDVLLEVINKGYNFYINNLFDEYTRPKADKNRLYPVDIHACAHSILFLCEINELYHDSIKIAKNVATWTIKNMQNHEEGFFYYRLYENGRIDKTPYIRWGEAPMLNALSRLYLMGDCKR